MGFATNRNGAFVVRIGLLLGLLSLLVAGLPGSAGAQSGGPLHLPAAMPGDRLLLTEHTPDDDQLWSVELDGSDRRLLSEGEADFAPRWAPDGTQVAFHRVGSEATDPWVADADGADARRLAPAGFSPAWAPDGRMVVFASAFAGSPGPLRIADVATGTLTDVPGTEGAVDPKWAPDGSHIAFVRTSEDGLVPAVGTARPDGGDLHAIVVEQLSGAPVWSPDGSHVAFAAAPAGEPYGLYAVHRSGTGLRLIARTFGGIQLEDVSAVAWAPDGERIAFSAGAPDGQSLDLYMVSVDGQTMWHPAPSDADDRVTGWTADGRAIVFTRFLDAASTSSERDAHLLRLDQAPATRAITTTGRSVVSDVGPGLALRVAGPDRIATAVQLSRLRDAADTVVIARADAYPDALAGAPLAAALGAPVLLTGRDRLDGRVDAEVRRLGATTAYLLGGEAALAPAVAADLGNAGVTSVERLSGANRFGTARRVAEAVVALTGATHSYVAEGAHADEGRGWPDAAAVSGLAALEGRPVLLVTRDALPEASRAAVTELGLTHATIVGGTEAVSAEVGAAIADTGAQVDRVAGSTRYATSAAIVDRALAAGATDARLWLATGRNWPDALAAGPAVAADSGVLLLVDGHGLAGSPPTRDRLAAASVARAVLVGGAGVLRPSTMTAVERLAPPSAPAEADETLVSVYFSREGHEPGEVFAVPRVVQGPAVLHGAMEALLRGPTPAEHQAGYRSWFSGNTAGMLRSVHIEDGTAHIDFDDFSDIIPNASTSAGSTALLAELDGTARHYASVQRARYTFAGDEAAFYEWLQLTSPK